MWDQWYGCYRHSYNCERCRLDETMKAISIDIFEWPLPTNSRHADAVVVKISIPRLVELWREVTWELVTDVFRDEKQDACYSERSYAKIRESCPIPCSPMVCSAILKDQIYGC